MRHLGPPIVLLGAWFVSAAAAAPGPYEATRERPLFSATRRPPPPDAAPTTPFATPQAALPPASPSVSLSGVILGPGANVALLSHPGGGEATRVALGGRIDGWLVSAIRARSVVLTLDDRSVTVALPDAPK